jgi:asparagine synthase (glutamine-hydrolysing)
MCGIVGYFKPRHAVKEYDLVKAAESIKHRGPDDFSMQNTTDSCIAFRRLSINDLSKRGMQPFHYDGVTVYINGEVYNHLELKAKYKDEFTPKSTSDAEILPFLFRKYGIGFANQINGMFAIVIIDSNTRKQYILLDRFGVKPMYYALRDKCLIFSSELKAFHHIFSMEPNYKNIALSFNLSFFPYPITPYKDVFKLTPGTFIEFTNGEMEEKRWYFMEVKEKITDPDYICEKFNTLFEQSIQYRLRGDVPVGSFLSGGLDSSSIAIEASRHYEKEFHVFNGVIDGKENTVDNINPVRLSKEYGLEFHKVDINKEFYENNLVPCIANYDDIMFEAGAMNFYAIQKEAKKYVTVMLDGIGGDELFLGYPKYLMYKKLPASIIDGINSVMPASTTLKYLLTRINRRGSKVYDILKNKIMFSLHLQEYIPSGFFWKDSEYDESYLEGLIKRNFDVCKQAIPDDPLNALGYLDFFNITNEQNIFSDRTGMAYSIESRNPYEDYNLVEFAMSIDSSVKTDGKITKQLFRKIHRNRLPDYILDAKKMGFSSPVYQWIFNSDLQKVFEKYIYHNKEILTRVIGDRAFETIMNFPVYRGTGTRWHMLMTYIIWHKINIERIDITDTEISIYDFCNTY